MSFLPFLFFAVLIGPTSDAAAENTCTLRKSLQRDWAQWSEDFKCRDLAVGEHRFVNESGTGTNGLSAQYLLLKTDSKSYQIDIPIKIVDSLRILPRLGKEGNASELQLEMDIRSCAEKSDSFLKGPNGEKIKLNPVMGNDLSTLERLTATKIEIKKAGFRSHRHGYDKNIDCPAIMHELLHLAGLVDEYPETDRDWKSSDGQKFNCRVRGPSSSIMNNHEASAADIKDPKTALHRRQYLHVEGLVCKKGQPETLCEKQHLVIPPAPDAIIPFGREAIEKILLANLPETLRGQYYVKDGKTQTPEKQLNSSVLEPAHFRALINPGCKKKNSLYYKCSSLAYKTDRAINQNGKTEMIEPCNIPPECLQGDWLK